MPCHQYNHFATTIPRPSYLNYSQFVASVNRAMNASQAPRPSCFGSDGLTNEELRRINGPIPLIHADVHDATERLENMHLDVFAAWHAPYYRSQAPSHSLLSVPPAPYVAESRSRSESPRVRPQGPRLKPSFGSTSAATTGSTYYTANYSLELSSPREYPHDPVEMLTELPPPRFGRIEKAFQKQQGIFQNAKVAGKKSVKNNRWYKEVGLGFKTPKEAIEGHYIDKKCPFTGDVSIRGRILTGEIISTKMKRTIIIRREYLHFISKYNRYEKRHKNLAAHMSPAFIGVQQGDSVTVGQCRPLSKTVRFNVLKVQKKVVKGAKNFAKF
ncbi:hypothetical protein BGX30_001075 [Mortierella sp. GBA39]|nr:hypothetical protein BGX30_001075 [Mortierella sp. GBA39]